MMPVVEGDLLSSNCEDGNIFPAAGYQLTAFAPTSGDLLAPRGVTRASASICTFVHGEIYPGGNRCKCRQYFN
jgi:hypothetical protein